MEDLNLVFVTELRKFELCSVPSSVFISVQLFLQQLLYSHNVTKGVGTANTVNDALQWSVDLVVIAVEGSVSEVNGSISVRFQNRLILHIHSCIVISVLCTSVLVCLPATLACVTIPLAKLDHKNGRNNSYFSNLWYLLKDLWNSIKLSFWLRF